MQGDGLALFELFDSIFVGVPLGLLLLIYPGRPQVSVPNFRREPYDG